MARVEAQSIAGFFALPQDQVPRIASLLRLEEYDDKAMENMRLSLLDPCAGEGDAIELLARLLSQPIVTSKKRRAAAYLIEQANTRRQRAIEAEAALAHLRENVPPPRFPYEGSKVRRKPPGIDCGIGTVVRYHPAGESCKTCLGAPEHLVVRWPVTQESAGKGGGSKKDQFDESPADLAVVDLDYERKLKAAEQNAQRAAEAVARDEKPEPPEEPVTETEAEVYEEIASEVPADVYTIEMERGRHLMLSKRPGLGWKNTNRALHGDAFCVSFGDEPKSTKQRSGVGVLYLNPPYEPNKVFGREEERFLRRFTDTLAPGGVLVFVVPYYAISASAQTLANFYEDVACYRLASDKDSKPDFYKQVVVFGKKLAQPRFEPDAEILKLAMLWSEHGAELPELPASESMSGVNHCRPIYTVPMNDRYHEPLSGWVIKPVDANALLAKFVPWHESQQRRGGMVSVSLVVPSQPLAEVMHRTYEVATPPRPAHIAAGLAAGLFNGQRIEPDTVEGGPESKLPPLLMKGCFDREWRTVEEKKDKHGETKSVLQVQQPKLVITVLDLVEHKYHTLGATLEASDAETVAGMGITDILKHYGKSLMRVMERQCVILYDPRYDGGTVTVANTPRRLYTAQEHAVKALVRILREKPGELPLLGAEIGSGKSTISLMTAKTLGAKSLLVLCPPHLIDSWRNEVAAVVPEAEYVVLDSISSVDALAARTDGKMVVAVLSRETAKLGHRLESVSGKCPKCYAQLGDGHDYAKKRERCEAQPVLPQNDYARLALELAVRLRPWHPDGVSRYLRPRLRFESELPAPIYTGLPIAFQAKIWSALVRDFEHGRHVHDSTVKNAIAWALAAFNLFPVEILSFAKSLKTDHYDYQHFVESVLLLIQPGGVLGMAHELIASLPPAGYGADSPAAWFQKSYTTLRGTGESEDESGARVGVHLGKGSLRVGENGLLLDGIAFGSVEAAGKLLKAIGDLASFDKGEPCGEPLYQSVPEPRRYPLAKYIVRKHKQTFDFVVADEIQEYANDTSAQTIAAHRLVALRKPMVFMTGTIMNGYAKSLFPTMTALSADFRSVFDRGDLSAFVDRYGYRKRILSDKEDGEIVAFGTQSDRVERSERDAGDAPGVLPLFLFRHLLASTVTLHKTDLRIDLPTLTQDREITAATPATQAEYTRMLDALKTQIKADMFQPGLAGKLFGQLSEFPSYLDCCTEDVGNVEGGGAFEIRYPDDMPEPCSDRSGVLVVAGEMLPASTILPKEQKMLAFVESEVAAGRNVMVLGWHLRLLPRLARLLTEKLGETVPVLYASKVPTAKRQAWIEKEVVGKKRRAMVVNPVCIQTGLNSLTHFSSQWWAEHPACNPLTFRQAVGRIDRIGQKQPTKTLFGYYGETLQEKIYDLLMAKVGISTAVDGLDPTAAWAAAGIVEDEHLLGLSLGKVLWDMMTREDGEGSNVVSISQGRRLKTLSRI